MTNSPWLQHENLPPAQVKKPRKQRSYKGATWVFSIGGAVLALAILTSYIVRLPPTVDTSRMKAGPAPEFATAEEVDSLFFQLNTALQTKDRDAFGRLLDRRADQSLLQWWDNMDAIGWETGSISLAKPYSESTPIPKNGCGKVRVIVGVAFERSPIGKPAGEEAASGQKFIQGFERSAEICDFEGISTLESMSPDYGEVFAPWDRETLYVAKGELTTVAGPSEAKEYIDQTLPTAEAAASWVMAQYAATGRSAPVNGFTLFINLDSATTLDPMFENGWDFSDDRMTMPTLRPPTTAPGIDPSIATGDETSSSYVVVKRQRRPITTQALVHEFSHVAHYAGAPSAYASPPRAVIEGWATYQELRFTNNDLFPTRETPRGMSIHDAIEVLDDVDFIPRNEPSTHSTEYGSYFLLTSTIYAYAAINGYDVYDLAERAKTTGKDLFTASAETEGKPPLTSDGWKEWVRANY